MCTFDGADLPLLAGEAVQKEYSTPGKRCHCIPCDAESCPAEFYVMTISTSSQLSKLASPLSSPAFPLRMLLCHLSDAFTSTGSSFCCVSWSGLCGHDCIVTHTVTLIKTKQHTQLLLQQQM